MIFESLDWFLRHVSSVIMGRYQLVRHAVLGDRVFVLLGALIIEQMRFWFETCQLQSRNQGIVR